VAQIRYGVIRELEEKLKAASAKLARAQASGSLLKEEVDEDDIAMVVAKWTGIPVARLLEGETEKLLHMEERLKARVVGQDDAIRAVSSWHPQGTLWPFRPAQAYGCIHICRANRRWENGAGKSLAWFLFDNEQALVRIDMSEYMENILSHG